MRRLPGRSKDNHNTVDQCVQTLFSFAAGDRCDGALRVSLGCNGVNPDRADENGQTLLSLAAGDGGEGVMRELLE